MKEDVIKSALKCIIFYLLVAENVVDDAAVLAADELFFVLDQFFHQQTHGEGVVLFS